MFAAPVFTVMNRKRSTYTVAYKLSMIDAVKSITLDLSSSLHKSKQQVASINGLHYNSLTRWLEQEEKLRPLPLKKHILGTVRKSLGGDVGKALSMRTLLAV